MHKSASQEVALHSAGITLLTVENAGSYMDNQAREIQTELGFNKDFRLARSAYDIVIVAQSEFAFKEDGLQLTADFEAAMKRLSGVMNQFDKTTITITGHTDSNGAERALSRAGGSSRHGPAGSAPPERLSEPPGSARPAWS